MTSQVLGFIASNATVIIHSTKALVFQGGVGTRGGRGGRVKGNLLYLKKFNLIQS